MHFTPEQLQYLRQLLQPTCCHVTGTHDPTHFQRDPSRLCTIQKADAWDRAVAWLGIAHDRAVSSKTCGWCARAREAAEAERQVEGLQALADFLRQAVGWSREPGREREERAHVNLRGARARVEYRAWHRIAGESSTAPLRVGAFVALTLPRYDPTKPIPEDGYPEEWSGLEHQLKAAVAEEVEDVGGVLLCEPWGGRNYLSVSLERPDAPGGVEQRG